jgi:tetratricopeptide (TPR) repeat protein
MTLMAWGRYQEALEAFDRAIGLTNDPLAWTSKGLVLLTLGDHGETQGARLGTYMKAQEAFDKSIAITFWNPDAWNHKGLVSQRIARVLADMAH